MKEPFPIPNRIAPELLEKIREKYFSKRNPPKARPVRVIKKSSGLGKNKGPSDPEEKG